MRSNHTKLRSNGYYLVSGYGDDLVFGLTRQGMASAMPSQAEKQGL